MTATDNHKPPATILVIDIGGSQVKILATGETDSRTCRSGKRFTPTQMGGRGPSTGRGLDV